MEIPLIVDGPLGEVAIRVAARQACDGAHLAAELVRVAGLPPGTPLFCGTQELTAELRLGQYPLLAGARLSCEPTETAAVPLTGLVLECVAGPDAGHSVSLRPESGPISIGRSENCHLSVADPALSNRHAVLEPGPGGWHLRDCASTNGVRRIHASSAPLAVGDLLALGDSILRINLADRPRLRLRGDDAGHLLVSRPAHPQPPRPAPIPQLPPDPPERTKRPIPLITALVTGLAGVGLALALRQPMFLIFAAFGPVIMLATAIGDRLSGRKSARAERASHRRACADYQLAKTAYVIAERSRRWQVAADPARLQRAVTARNSGLWAGSPDADKALEFTVGVGTAEIEDTELADVPATILLSPGAVVGLVDPNRDLARNILSQVLAGYAPGDVALLGPTHLADTPHAHCQGIRVYLVDLDAGDSMPSDDAAIVLAAASTAADLPRACTQLLDCADLRLPGYRDAVVPTGVSQQYLDQILAGVLPLRIDLPHTGILPTVAHPDSAQLTWQRPSATVYVGECPDGPLQLNLDADGPHLLIAGTTGSGKSELLLTLIGGLAAAAPPQHTSFLLIDYKGGAAFRALNGIPHITATVTDLDAELAERALMSLRAEIRAREKLLASAHATSVQELRASGKPAPARLVIVVDEFATLAAELPSFISGLVDIAQRGRSLGLHLILATQRPAGVVSPAIKANMSCRICLRVTDDAESMDVIDTAAAARLPTDVPGRAVLRTAAGRPTIFQTALVTAPSASLLQVWRADRARPRRVGQTMLAEIAQQCIGHPQATPAPAPAPYLPPLPSELRLPDPQMLGRIDNPHSQAQPDWPRPTGSLLITGPPGAGASTAALRFLASHPGAELVIVDAAGGLQQAANWAATSSYLRADDPELILAAMAALTQLCLAKADDRQVLAVFDGWEPIRAACDQLDFGWQQRLGEIAARGGRAGVHLAITGPPPLATHRIAGSFSEHLALATVAGDRTMTPAGGPPGRGTLHRQGQPELGVQVALPGTAQPKPAPSKHVTIRALPDRVETLPPPQQLRIPIGYGGYDTHLISVDLATGGAFLVAGPYQAGVSTTLSVLAAGAATAGAQVIWACTTRTPAPPGLMAVDVRATCDELREVLAAAEGPILLVADDVDTPDRSGLHQLLLHFLQASTAGQMLALGCRLDRALRAGPAVTEAISFRHGLLLGADGLDGGLFGCQLPKRTRPQQPGRGHLVYAGQVTALQVACP